MALPEASIQHVSSDQQGGIVSKPGSANRQQATSLSIIHSAQPLVAFLPMAGSLFVIVVIGLIRRLRAGDRIGERV
jgi:hypothetical protein